MERNAYPGTEAGSEGPPSTARTVPQGPVQHLPLLGQLLMKKRSATPEERQLAATDQTYDTDKAVATLLQRLAAAAQRPQQQVQEQQQQQDVETLPLPAPVFGGVAPLPRPAAATAAAAAAAAGFSCSTTVSRSQPIQQQLQQHQRDPPTHTRKPAGPTFKHQQQQQAPGAKLRMKPGKHLAAAAAREARQSGAAAASIAQWRRKPLNLNAAKTPGRLSGPVPSPRTDAPPRVPATFQQQQQQQWPASGPTWPNPAAAAAAAADVAVPGRITSSSHFFGGAGVSYTSELPAPVLSPPSFSSSHGVQRGTHGDSVDSYIGIQPTGPQVAAAAAGGSGVVPAWQIRSHLIRSGGGSHTHQQIMNELGRDHRDRGHQQPDLDHRSDLGPQIRDPAHRPGAAAVKVEPASLELLQPSVMTTPAAAAAAAAAAASGGAVRGLSGLELLMDAAAAVLAPEASALPKQQQQPQQQQCQTLQQQQPQTQQQQQQHRLQDQQHQLLHMKELQHQLQQLQAEFWQQQQGPAAAAAPVDQSHEQQQQQHGSLQEQHQRLQHIQQRLEALRAQAQQPPAASPHQPMVQQQQQGALQAHAGSQGLPVSSNLRDWLSHLTTLSNSGLNVQHPRLPQDPHTTAAAAAAGEQDQQQQQQQQHNDAWQGIYQPGVTLQGSNAPRSQNPAGVSGGFALPVQNPTLQPPTVIYPYTSTNPNPDLVIKPDILNPSSSSVPNPSALTPRTLNPSPSNPGNRVTSHAEQLQQLQHLLFQLKQSPDLHSNLEVQPAVNYSDAILSQPAPLDMCAFRSVLADILETHKEAKALVQQAANLGLITRPPQQTAAAAAGNGGPGAQQSAFQQQRQQQGVLLAPSGYKTAEPIAELRLPELLPRDEVALQDNTAQPAAAAAAALPCADLDQPCQENTARAAAAAPLAAAAEPAAELYCGETADLDRADQTNAPEPAAAAAAELRGADIANVNVDQLHQANAAEPPPPPAAAVAAAAAEQQRVDPEESGADQPPLKRRRTDGLTVKQEWVPAAAAAGFPELAAVAAAAVAEGQCDTDTAGGRVDQRVSKRCCSDVKAQNPGTAAAAAAAGEQSATVSAKPSPVTADSQAAAAAAAAHPLITADPKPHGLQCASQLEPCDDREQQQQQQQQHQDRADCQQQHERQPPPVLLPLPPPPPPPQQQQGDRAPPGSASSVQQADQPQEEQTAGFRQQQQHEEATTDAAEGRVAHQPAAAAACKQLADVTVAEAQQSAADNTLEVLPAVAAAAAPAVDWDASADLLGRIAAVLSKMQQHMHGLAFLAIPCAADLLLVRGTAADLICQIAADLDRKPPAATAAAEGLAVPDPTQQGDRQTASCLNVLKSHVTSLQQQAARDRATVADQQQQISNLQQQLAATAQQQRQQARLVAAAVTQMMGVVNSTAGLSDQDRMSLITAGAELLQSML